MRVPKNRAWRLLFVPQTDKFQLIHPPKHVSSAWIAFSRHNYVIQQSVISVSPYVGIYCTDISGPCELSQRQEILKDTVTLKWCTTPKASNNMGMVTSV